jgi:hypothetical protein
VIPEACPVVVDPEDGGDDDGEGIDHQTRRIRP